MRADTPYIRIFLLGIYPLSSRVPSSLIIAKGFSYIARIVVSFINVTFVVKFTVFFVILESSISEIIISNVVNSKA